MNKDIIKHWDIKAIEKITQDEAEAMAEEYKGMTAICGNFATYSHAFNLYTDDADLIKELETAIRKNQQTEAYKEIKAQLIRIK